MASENGGDELAELRQQVMALASVTGVLVAALRQGGLMTAELELLLGSGLADAAAAQSEQVRPAWDRVIGAVQMVSAAAFGAE